MARPGYAPTRTCSKRLFRHVDCKRRTRASGTVQAIAIWHQSRISRAFVITNLSKFGTGSLWKWRTAFTRWAIITSRRLCRYTQLYPELHQYLIQDMLHRVVAIFFVVIVAREYGMRAVRYFERGSLSSRNLPDVKPVWMLCDVKLLT